jgi:hypothetical protein
MFGSGQFRPLVVTRSLNGSATWTCYRPKDAPNQAEPHQIDGRFDMTWLLAAIPIWVVNIVAGHPWLLAAISICVVNVVAGRAHSRHLDRREAKAKADPAVVYLNVSPITVEQLDASFDCTKKERITSSQPERRRLTSVPL